MRLQHPDCSPTHLGFPQHLLRLAPQRQHPLKNRIQGEQGGVPLALALQLSGSGSVLGGDLALLGLREGMNRGGVDSKMQFVPCGYS